MSEELSSFLLLFSLTVFLFSPTANFHCGYYHPLIFSSHGILEFVDLREASVRPSGLFLFT